MNIKDATLKEFIEDVKETKKCIVLCGMGVIGKTSIPFFLEKQNFSDKVVSVVDTDVHKQGKDIRIGNQQITIEPLQKINTLKDRFVLLITASRYYGMLLELEKLETLSDVDVYIFPQMLVKECRVFEKKEIKKYSLTPLIPKIIHYCWFGGNELPQKHKENIASWKRFCPGFEVIEWNEDNYDVSQWAYTRQALSHGKWSYIPDIVRLDVLHRYGGIYFDTDVEVIKPIDDLLFQKGFCGTEKWGIVNIGGGCGVVPKHPMINKILKYRLGFEFEYANGDLNLESSGSYETIPMIEEGFVPNNTIQSVMDMTIYSSDFFHPYDYMSKELCITENTYSIHRFAESWL